MLFIFLFTFLLACSPPPGSFVRPSVASVRTRNTFFAFVIFIPHVFCARRTHNASRTAHALKIAHRRNAVITLRPIIYICCRPIETNRTTGPNSNGHGALIICAAYIGIACITLYIYIMIHVFPCHTSIIRFDVHSDTAFGGITFCVHAFAQYSFSHRVFSFTRQTRARASAQPKIGRIDRG